REPRYEGARQQLHVWKPGERRIDADHLRIRLTVQEARESIEEAASHARARRGRFAILLIEQNTQRQMKGMQTNAAQIGSQLGNPGLVTDWSMRIIPAGPGLQRILAALTMHVEEALRLRVIRLK